MVQFTKKIDHKLLATLTAKKQRYIKQTSEGIKGKRKNI